MGFPNPSPLHAGDRFVSPTLATPSVSVRGLTLSGRYFVLKRLAGTKPRPFGHAMNAARLCRVRNTAQMRYAKRHFQRLAARHRKNEVPLGASRPSRTDERWVTP